MVEEQIQKLKTLQESFDALSQGSISIESKVDEVKEAVNNIDLSPVESKVEEGVNTLSSKIDNIDLTPIESKVDEGVSTLSTKIDNIDLSSVAKQGENQEATNTAILKAVSAIVDTKNLYSVRFESNDDGPNTYTMVLPVVAGVVGDTIIL